jgi:catechol 2,3-dioxygenase-like lactoylglutathione lyase family enzyme
VTPLADGLDHVVLTARDLAAAIDFWRRATGIEAVEFAPGRWAVPLGAQKINLQTLGMETRNHACIGSGDLCLVSTAPAEAVAARLQAEGIAVVEGPVRKTGARGPMLSVYCRDPDGNLIEFGCYGA